MALEIVERNSGGITVLELSGHMELGEENSKVRSKFKEVLERGKTRVVLDLGKVEEIDSAGLGTLVSGYTSARNQGASMKLANPTEKFKNQLNMTKLVTVFEVYNSVEEAVKSFSEASH